MRQITLFLIILIPVAATLAVTAQSNQVWAGIDGTINVSKPWDVVTAISWRKSVGQTKWRKALLQVGAIYSVGRFRFVGNSSVFHTSGHQDPNILEIRPWQGVSARFPDWKRGEIVHLVRFEERFQREEGNWSFSPRIRYELSTRIAISRKTLGDAKWYLYGALEWLNNFNRPLHERFANAQASSAGIGHRFSRKSGVEAVYEADVTDNIRDNIRDVDVHIVRIRWLNVL